MNAKISVLAICGEAIIYLLLYNLLGYTFNKRVNAEAAAHCCSVAVLNNLNILIEAAVCRYSSNRSFQKFCNMQRKKSVLESLFNKVAGLQLSCKYCEIFKNSFFHKTSLVAASEKFRNVPGKHQWQRRNKFIFLINTIE